MALLEPSLERIAPLDPTVSSDRADDWVAGGTPEPLASALRAIVGERGLLGRASDLIRYASDASPYRSIPRAVVQPRRAAEVAAVLAHARRGGIPAVFRAAGTSLNGQSQTDGIMIDVRRHWAGLEVLDQGERIRAQPGAILGHANRLLAPLGRRLGPDPASTDVATVGGVVANNSGGMRCGITADSYSTVVALSFVLPSGTAIDTGVPGASERFERLEPELARGLAELRDEIRSDADLRERIRRKFEIKNTMGYRLCAFLDADEPVEIFRRLLIGSEGTLAFTSEVVFETVPLPARTSLAWIHFAGVDAATVPVAELVAAGASAVELMVAPALMVAASSIPGTPEYWKELPLESAALLVELPADDEDGLAEAEAHAREVLDRYDAIRAYEFSRDPETIELFWRVREGLHGLIGQLRPPGTALIIEDVCVAPARLADAARDLRELLAEHGFLTGVAGHASAGNLHFMLTPDFSSPEDVERYEAFLEGLADLVIDTYDGSLKAEHGTGINMAPFLEREWGPQATELMWRIKRLADPDGVLGPGVLLNRDRGAHLENLKTTPQIEDSVTSCVECGLCEPVCPSRELTLTPRQRIVLRREMARQPAGSPLLERLLEEYAYDGIETCAADGSCAPACPLSIDTGKLITGLRFDQHGPREERVALAAANRWAAVERAARAGLGLGAAVSGAVGDAPMRGVTKALRRAVSAELAPAWAPPLPPPAAGGMPATERTTAAAVYLPACVNRIFGRSPDGGRHGRLPSLPVALVEVSARAGKPVWIPPDVAGTCCATPWTSKGYRRGAEQMARATVEKLWRWSGEGELPVVIDASSCTQGVAAAVAGIDDERLSGRFAAIEVLDSIEWAAEHLLAGLRVGRRVRRAVIHPTCSSDQLGLDGTLERVVAELAEQVRVPTGARCCGFAGDRGFLHPELTAAATAEEAREVTTIEAEAHVCANRTCEIGMERATGRPYESFIYLLEELTRLTSVGPIDAKA